jgi:pimeloyl-ACP methyl ester carboxylesterase
MNSIVTSLVPWQHTTHGVTIRGWMTPNCGRNGRPIIHFLHGNGLSNLTYWPFLKHFEHEYDLFLGSVEGHGDSDHRSQQERHDWSTLTTEALECYEAMSASWDPQQPVIALAHSFGAVVTTLMQGNQKRRFDQYILLDPVIFPRSTIALMRLLNLIGVAQKLPHVRQAIRRRSAWPTRDEAFNSLHGRGAFKFWTDESLRCYVEHGTHESVKGEWQLRCPPWLEARIFSGYPKRLWSAIGELPVDTYIVHSLATYPFIPKAARQAEKANPHVHRLEVEGTHCFMQEHPEATYRKIRTLLKF